MRVVAFKRLLGAITMSFSQASSLKKKEIERLPVSREKPVTLGKAK
jgi:hypothetical protein